MIATTLTAAELGTMAALPVELRPVYEHERELYSAWLDAADAGSDAKEECYDAWSEANDTLRELLDQCSRRGSEYNRAAATRVLNLLASFCNK